MRKNSLTLLITIGCMFGIKEILNFQGEILSRYQLALLFMLTYLSICEVLK